MKLIQNTISMARYTRFAVMVKHLYGCFLLVGLKVSGLLSLEWPILLLLIVGLYWLQSWHDYAAGFVYGLINRSREPKASRTNNVTLN